MKWHRADANTQLRHSNESCTACLAYLFQNETELLSLATAYLMRRSSSSRSSGSVVLNEEDRVRVLGTVVWEIFSDNHEVVDSEGKIFDLGSWRGSGGFIADFLDARFAPEDKQWFHYMDFYGGFYGGHEPSLFSLYEYFFRRLKERKYTWRYAPPAMNLVDFSAKKPETEIHDYDPGSAILEDLKKTEEQEAKEDLRKSVEAGNTEMRKKEFNTSPIIVLAYKEVFGKLPIYLER